MNPPYKDSEHAADRLGDLVHEPLSSNPTNTIDCGRDLVRPPILVNDVRIPVTKHEGEARLFTMEMREYPMAKADINLIAKGKSS